MSSAKIQPIKLVWRETTIKDWYHNHNEEILFVASGSETPVEHGYFEGYSSLSKEQIDSIECFECFYYHSKQCEKENEADEDCECHMGREYSSLIVEPFCNIYDDIVTKCIEPMLEIEQ